MNTICQSHRIKTNLEEISPQKSYSKSEVSEVSFLNERSHKVTTLSAFCGKALVEQKCSNLY